MVKTSDLTGADKRRIIKYLSEADEYEKDSALRSKRSFFKWLTEVGFGHIVVKLFDLAWKVIRAVFFLLVIV